MPDQVDWRAIEREATPGRAVGRLLRDQREARGLGLSDVEKSLRIRRSSPRGDRGRSLRQAAGRCLHPGLPARLCGPCRTRSREGADRLSSLRSGSHQASRVAAGRFPDRRKACADRPRRADRSARRRRRLRRLALSAARAVGGRREGSAGAGSSAGDAARCAVARCAAARGRRSVDDGRSRGSARPGSSQHLRRLARRSLAGAATGHAPRSPRLSRRPSSSPCPRRRRRS